MLSACEDPYHQDSFLSLLLLLELLALAVRPLLPFHLTIAYLPLPTQLPLTGGGAAHLISLLCWYWTNEDIIITTFRVTEYTLIIKYLIQNIYLYICEIREVRNGGISCNVLRKVEVYIVENKQCTEKSWSLYCWKQAYIWRREERKLPYQLHIVII